MSLPIRIFLFIVAIAIFCGVSDAQKSADNQNLKLTATTDQDDEDRPKSIKESLEKMRIEQDKKDHQEMIDRGEEAVKLTTDLQKDFDTNGKLSNDDLVKLARVEKIIKKVRDELGGDDDEDQTAPAELRTGSTPLGGALGLLKSSADTLFDELKKSTRFTISAAAIVSSNAVLKLARILRFGH